MYRTWRYNLDVVKCLNTHNITITHHCHHIIATSQRPTSPYQHIFNHEFYDCKQAMDKIAKIIISNA
ncbi:unnamed protein product [Rhizophagus irregularis]|nr:unnamed protein product [Rhizophagus irregularis]